MIRSLITSSLLLSTPLLAEKVGAVNYLLPENPSWQLSLQQGDEAAQTRLYIPSGATPQTAREYFAAISTDQKESSARLDDILAALKANLPEHTVTAAIIEQNPNDVTYEWSAVKGDQQISGITKGFNTHPGTVLLTYQTFGTPDKATKERWLKLLAAARQE